MSLLYALGPVKVTLFEKRVFVKVTKDLKVRSSWANWAGPPSYDRCPYK